MPRLLKEQIVRMEELAPGIWRMGIQSEFIAQNAKPGQFVNIKCREGLDAYLRRPISICSINPRENTVDIVFQIKGTGTRFLSEKKPGEKLDLIAPLGWGTFSIEPKEKVIIVGGGIGIFPLLELTKQLGGHCPSRTVILGFRSKDLVVMESDFQAHCESLKICTDDGSYGIQGFTTALLEEEIKNHGADRIYTCGPMPMIKRVAGIAAQHQIDCEVSLEERMGCGFGACLVCACKTKHGAEWEHSHVCFNGPVFNSREVLF